MKECPKMSELLYEECPGETHYSKFTFCPGRATVGRTNGARIRSYYRPRYHRTEALFKGMATRAKVREAARSLATWSGRVPHLSPQLMSSCNHLARGGHLPYKLIRVSEVARRRRHLERAVSQVHRSENRGGCWSKPWRGRLDHNRDQRTAV